MVKHLPAVWKTQVRSLGWEDPLEKEMATTQGLTLLVASVLTPLV